MATATETLDLGTRALQPQADACPVAVTEKAAKEVKQIVHDQRIALLTELTPELAEKYKTLPVTNTVPDLTDLINATGISEPELVRRLGVAAAGKPNQMVSEIRDLYRNFQTANGRTPNLAELSEMAKLPEDALIMKLGENPAAILRRVYLRLRVVGGGCSGFQNKLDLDPVASPKLDETFEQHNVPIVIDRRSLMYLTGVSIDYHDDLNRRGFSISNPNAKTTCGCGSSYSM